MTRDEAVPSIGRLVVVATRVTIVVVVAIMLAGCGKKGNPQPPPGEPVTYPRQYPAQ
jgi:predicted small lipoprotein YifL